MQPLDERRRNRFSALSAILCSVPIFLVPLAARSSLEPQAANASIERSYRIPTLTPALKSRIVKISRDPFVPDPEVSSEPSSRSLPAFDSGARALPIVRAIVSGAAPRALVAENGTDRIVAVGDALAGSRVTRIDPMGVRLENGSILSLSEDTR